mmetsp:Transcript_21480/g.55092  ORF Transcript_21480/g.55092 Transcript_21480/m.55092 type:complete len:217 (-) Transcript_21480:78-728(-)
MALEPSTRAISLSDLSTEATVRRGAVKRERTLERTSTAREPRSPHSMSSFSTAALLLPLTSLSTSFSVASPRPSSRPSCGADSSLAVSRTAATRSPGWPLARMARKASISTDAFSCRLVVLAITSNASAMKPYGTAAPSFQERYDFTLYLRCCSAAAMAAAPTPSFVDLTLEARSAVAFSTASNAAVAPPTALDVPPAAAQAPSLSHSRSAPGEPG